MLSFACCFISLVGCTKWCVRKTLCFNFKACRVKLLNVQRVLCVGLRPGFKSFVSAAHIRPKYEKIFKIFFEYFLTFWPTVWQCAAVPSQPLSLL